MLILFICSCSIKHGKVVIMLSGRYAGRKAVVVKASDEGNESKKFGHALGKWIQKYLLAYYDSSLCVSFDIAQLRASINILSK
jgi:hypothetical protein